MESQGSQCQGQKRTWKWQAAGKLRTGSRLGFLFFVYECFFPKALHFFHTSLVHCSIFLAHVMPLLLPSISLLDLTVSQFNSDFSGHSNSFMHLTFYHSNPQPGSFTLSTFSPPGLASTADCESTMNSLSNYWCFYSSLDYHMSTTSCSKPFAHATKSNVLLFPWCLICYITEWIKSILY